jgi:hypothetical protein
VVESVSAPPSNASRAPASARISSARAPLSRVPSNATVNDRAGAELAIRTRPGFSLVIAAAQRSASESHVAVSPSRRTVAAVPV